MFDLNDKVLVTESNKSGTVTGVYITIDSRIYTVYFGAGSVGNFRENELKKADDFSDRPRIYTPRLQPGVVIHTFYNGYYGTAIVVSNPLDDRIQLLIANGSYKGKIKSGYLGDMGCQPYPNGWNKTNFTVEGTLEEWQEVYNK